MLPPMSYVTQYTLQIRENEKRFLAAGEVSLR